MTSLSLTVRFADRPGPELDRLPWKKFWQSFLMYLLTFFFGILSDILSDILYDILLASSDILSDVWSDILLFLTYLRTFFLKYLGTFFLTYLVTLFLTYLAFYLTLFLTYQKNILFHISSDILFGILSDIRSCGGGPAERFFHSNLPSVSPFRSSLMFMEGMLLAWFVFLLLVCVCVCVLFVGWLVVLCVFNAFLLPPRLHEYHTHLATNFNPGSDRHCFTARAAHG